MSNSDINRKFPPAPTDIRLRTFLISLSKEIGMEDLGCIKFLLKGDGKIGESVLEDCQRGIDVFDRLIHRGWLNENNIVILQAIVWKIGRKDLYTKMVDFAKENRNMLHIGPPKHPENGSTHARFHLHGEPDRQKAEDMRSEIANWLCVPKHLVVIAGVEETGSWTITFMIPEMCVQTLIMVDQAQKQRLTELEVDTFEVDGQVFNILPITTAKQSEVVLPMGSKRVKSENPAGSPAASGSKKRKTETSEASPAQLSTSKPQGPVSQSHGTMKLRRKPLVRRFADPVSVSRKSRTHEPSPKPSQNLRVI